MTVIRPNSISGVTSITAQGGDINVFRADGTAGDLVVNNINAGVSTFSGNVSIGGTLTYEDVTNIDSVGVITARSSINVNNAAGSGIGVTINSGGINVVGVATVNGDVQFNDSDGTHRVLYDSSDTSLNFVDNAKIKLGSSGDLEVFHDGSNSYVKDTGTGSLLLRGSTISLQSVAGEAMIEGVADGAVTIKHDNTTRLQTTSAGVEVTGRIALMDSGSNGTGNALWIGSGNDLKLYHDGTESTILSATGGLVIKDTGGYMRIRSDELKIQSEANETYIEADSNGAVQLFHNDSKKLETSSSGAIVTGDFEATNDLILSGANANLRWDKSDDALEFMDNGKAVFGNGDDLKIYHQNSNNTSYLYNTSTDLTLMTGGNNINVKSDTGEFCAKFVKDGAAELYYNNVKQLETNIAGITLPKGGIYGMGGSMVLLGGIINPGTDRTWKFPFNTNHAGTNNGYEFTIEIVLNHWNHGDYYKILERYLFGRGNTTSYQTVTKIDDRGGSSGNWNTSHFDQVVNLSGGSSGFPAALEITYDAESAPAYTSGYHIFVRHSGTMGIPVIV